ncbi:MAG: hypothetical protein KAU01_02870 [Candidatus Cloacimonetes bacterium]|nr:hypothetical protein [Candidatus Cloacimonadota bacterium]
MSYLKDYKSLNEKFNLNEKKIELKEQFLKIYNIPFESFSYKVLPGEDKYRCNEHNRIFKNIHDFKSDLNAPYLNKILEVRDSKIQENIYFNYSVLQSLKPVKEKTSKDKDKRGKPKNKKPKREKPKGAIIILHGLNEKDWSKYLPWAKKLSELTGKSVILFPIAFHMNRAPEEWIDPKLMNNVNRERKKFFPNLSNSSFANAAISTRLQFYPQRFLWSGLQTYFDIIQLVKEIKSGFHPLIGKDERIDFFSYSVGSFLAMILLMTNPYNCFNESKLFIFCGGPTLNRMSASSKYIMDSEANIAVYSYFIEHLEKELKKDERLAHYFSKLHPVGNYFKSMLDYHKMKDFREKRLKEISKRICALVLKEDIVVPPSEVMNTLKGAERKIPIKVKIMDFEYKYDHVVPFPLKENIEKEVDRDFNKVFKYAAKHLK